jgi:hypothetical protein
MVMFTDDTSPFKQLINEAHNIILTYLFAIWTTTDLKRLLEVFMSEQRVLHRSTSTDFEILGPALQVLALERFPSALMPFLSAFVEFSTPRS